MRNVIPHVISNKFSLVHSFSKSFKYSKKFLPLRNNNIKKNTSYIAQSWKSQKIFRKPYPKCLLVSTVDYFFLLEHNSLLSILNGTAPENIHKKKSHRINFIYRDAGSIFFFSVHYFFLRFKCLVLVTTWPPELLLVRYQEKVMVSTKK